MPEFLDSETLSMVFDVVLICSVAALWFLWWKQLQQRKNIEAMLVEASTELQDATLMLNEALAQIQYFQENSVGGESAQQSVEKSNEASAKELFKERMQQQVVRSAEDESQPTANISQVAQMLRLQREGMAAEKISEKLNMPLAQVKLMLMLQSSPKL